MLAAYCATKALMTFLCESIDREYSTINVQTLIPALVATKMTYYTVSSYLRSSQKINLQSYFQKGSTFVVTPENFCHQAVGSIGLTKKTAGCLNHELQMLGFHLFPWTILKYLIMPIYYHQRKRVTELHNTSNNPEQEISLQELNEETVVPTTKKTVTRDSATA